MLSLSLKQGIENGALLNSFQLDLGLHRETCHRVTGGELGGFYPRPWFAPTQDTHTHASQRWHHRLVLALAPSILSTL